MRTVPALTPGQASYVIERLVAERKISVADVQRCLDGMQSEIAALERQIAELRGNVAAAPRARQARAAAPKKKRADGRKGHLRGIAGTFDVLTRDMSAADRAKYLELRATKGLAVAVAVLRKAIKKG
ncbi:MAG: hypothetical protein ACYC7A_18005 [Thermoanaerobaculia bacterium]